MISWLALSNPKEENFYIDRTEKMIMASPVAGNGMDSVFLTNQARLDVRDLAELWDLGVFVVGGEP